MGVARVGAEVDWLKEGIGEWLGEGLGEGLSLPQSVALLL